MPSLHTYWSLTSIIQDGISSRMSLGPSPLHGQNQMSAVWGKICSQIPQRGESRSVQMPHLFPYPPPLHLNIDMCIHRSVNWIANKNQPKKTEFYKFAAQENLPILFIFLNLFSDFQWPKWPVEMQVLTLYALVWKCIIYSLFSLYFLWN